jgi:hypothetical protein
MGDIESLAQISGAQLNEGNDKLRLRATPKATA